MNSGSSNATSAPRRSRSVRRRSGAARAARSARRGAASTTDVRAYASTPSSRTPGLGAAAPATHCVVAAGAQRSLGEREVLGTVVVHDQQPVAGRLHLVLDALPPRARRCAARPPGRRWPAAGTSEVILLSQPNTSQRSSRLAVDAEPEPLVGLGQHLDVVGGRIGVERVPQHDVRPPGLVAAACRRGGVSPAQATPVAVSAIVSGRSLAGPQVADPQGVALGAGDVGRVGEQVSRPGTRRARRGREKSVPGRLDVGVEVDLLAGDLSGQLRRRTVARCRRRARQ